MNLKCIRRRFVRVLLVAGSVGCGAAAPPLAQAPASEAVAVAAPAPPPPDSSSLAASAPASAPVTVASMARHDGLGGAWNDLVGAQQALDASAGSCTAACRALGSMDRAVGQLCKFAASADDTGKCDDAREKLIGARARVRTACGSCPGGPTVDPKAPAPTP